MREVRETRAEILPPEGEGDSPVASTAALVPDLPKRRLPLWPPWALPLTMLGAGLALAGVARWWVRRA